MGKGVNLKVNQECNSNCTFCYEHDKPRRLMSVAEIDQILLDLQDNDFRYLKLSGGEPLLRDDLNQIIQQAHLKGFKTQLATNGILLDKERLVELNNSGLNEVYISLGSTICINEVQRYSDLCTYAKENNLQIKIGVNIITGKTFLQDMIDSFLFLAQNGFTLIYLIPPKMSKNLKWYRQEALDFVDYYQLFKVIDHYKKYIRFVYDCSFYWLHSFREFIENGQVGNLKCNAGKETFVVRCDGTLLPCPYFDQDKFTLGNLLNNNFKQIIQDNRQLADFRKSMSECEESVITWENPCMRLTNE